MRPGQRLYFFLFFFVMIVFLINLNRFMSSREYRKDYYYQVIDSLPKFDTGIDIKRMDLYLSLKLQKKRPGHVYYQLESEINFAFNSDSVQKTAFYLADSWTVDHMTHPDLKVTDKKYYFEIEPISPKKNYTIHIKYHGKPSLYHEWIKGFTSEMKNFGVFPQKRLVFANFFPPHGAQTILFGNDLIEDKIDTFSVQFEVPDNIIPVSAGELEVHKKSDHRVIYKYQSHYPLAAHLIPLYGAPYNNFKFSHSGSESSFDVNLYFYPYEREVDTVAIANRIESVLHFIEKKCGPYPFIKDGLKLVEFPYGGGMETQACIGLNEISLGNELLMAHEISHQYFGDKITPQFRDVWLSEGFATYLTALYIKSAIGEKEFFEFMNARKNQPEQSLLVDHIENPDSLYNYDLVYNKGAWVLFMIHTIIGDKQFNTLLQQWLSQDPKHYVTTQDFQKILENLTGRNWKDFFHYYVIKGLRPQFQFNSDTHEVFISNIAPDSSQALPIILKITRTPQVLNLKSRKFFLNNLKNKNITDVFKYNPGAVQIRKF